MAINTTVKPIRPTHAMLAALKVPPRMKRYSASSLIIRIDVIIHSWHKYYPDEKRRYAPQNYLPIIILEEVFTGKSLGSFDAALIKTIEAHEFAPRMEDRLYLHHLIDLSALLAYNPKAKLTFDEIRILNRKAQENAVRSKLHA